jgi:hypothetical protein
MGAIPYHKLFLALICGLLFGCSTYNWPYYKLHAASAKVIDRSAFQYTVEISILQDVILQVRSACYPKSEDHFRGYRPCDIWIYIFGPASTNLEFVSSNFVVEDINQPEAKYEAKVSVFDSEDFDIKQTNELRPGIIRRKWLKIDLEYEHDNPTKKFKLHSPALMIDGESYDVPSITGIYTKNIEFFWGFMNW